MKKINIPSTRRNIILTTLKNLHPKTHKKTKTTITYPCVTTKFSISNYAIPFVVEITFVCDWVDTIEGLSACLSF